MPIVTIDNRITAQGFLIFPTVPVAISFPSSWRSQRALAHRNPGWLQSGCPGVAIEVYLGPVPGVPGLDRVGGHGRLPVWIRVRVGSVMHRPGSAHLGARLARQGILQGILVNLH